MQEQRYQGEEGAAGIAGLRYVPEFITTEEEDAQVRSLEQLDWNNPLPRRTHHFGYMYDFTSRRGAIEGVCYPPLQPIFHLCVALSLPHHRGVPKEHPRVPVPSEPFPDWLRQLAARLCESGAMPHVPDQVIANEYHLFPTLLPPAKSWLTLCGLLVPQVHARPGTGIPH